MPYLHVALALLAGVVIFLYGVTRLSEGVKALAGDRMRQLIARFTNNRLAGVATGTVATTVLDSSSITIIMTIALVNAGALSFAQSLGVILGANIGTTISSQLIAFDVDQFAPVVLLLGFVLHVAGRSDAQKHAGLAVLGVGLIFFGLHEMGEAVEPLKRHEPLIDFLARMENPLLGVAAGAAFTVVIQSSSATLAMVITLASQGLLSLPAGVAIMLGAEIGTCADTLLATIGRSREAVRAGVFHLGFNVVTVLAGVALAPELAELAQRLAPGAGIARHVANAHLLFNALGVAAVLGPLPYIARALERIIPTRRAPAAGAPPTPHGIAA